MGKLIYYHLFDIKVKSGYIEAKILKEDFEAAIKEEKGELLVIVEDGVKVFYMASPVSSYRVFIVDKK